MTKYLILIYFFILGISLSCKNKTSDENLNKILDSKRYTVKLIYSRGNYSGRPSKSESEEKFEVVNESNRLNIKYFKPSYHSDSIFQFNLNKSEADSLAIILKLAVKTHNPNKRYESCCMCSNIDFLIFNDDIKMEVKSSQKIEDLFYNFTQKYNKILIKKQEEYYNKIH